MKKVRRCTKGVISVLLATIMALSSAAVGLSVITSAVDGGHSLRVQLMSL
ncbi:MAG: hypothetical protein MJ168_05805 [Clostridia bacterium]|nr:hypothetical protein [Clostridia bacterium]